MKTSIRTDTKLWVFEDPSSGGTGIAEIVYVFGYTWFEARTGALAALQRSSGLVHGREIENIKEHIVEEGSTIAFVDRGSTWFEIVETCRQMSGEEARTLLAFPAFGEASPTPEPTVSELPVVEPAFVESAEPEPVASRTHPSSEALRALLIANAEHNSDWPEMANIASQAIDALEAMEAKISQCNSASFEDAWKEKVAEGYQYGSDALEQVRFGWDIRNATVAAEILRLQDEAKAIELARFRAARQAEDYRVLGAKQEKALHMARQGEKDCRIQLEAAVERIYEMERAEDLLKAQKEVAYEERNRLVALFASMALAMGWRAGIGLHEDPASGGTGKPEEGSIPLQAGWDPEWRTFVMVETPEGQATWHFHDSQKHLVAHLPPNMTKWDGHDTSTKYVRLEQLMHRTMIVETVSAIEAQLATIKACAEARLDEQRIAVVEGAGVPVVEVERDDASEETWVVNVGGKYVAHFGDTEAATAECNANNMAERLRSALTGLWPRPSAGQPLVQDMTRNPTTEEELARVRSELNYYRDKCLNDDRIPIADAEILELHKQVDAAKSDALGWAEKYGEQIIECSDEYERGKEEADELHLRMLELRDAEAYKRGLREAAEVCQAVSSKMNERGKAKVFADAIVGTAQWEQRQRYEAGRDVAHDCGTRIEALAKKAST